MTEPEHQTLRAAFDAAERQREALERGQPPGMAAYGDAVAAAVAAYERCAARIDLLALFSPNEAAEDLATAHLRYLLVPLRVAELVQRLPVVPGSSSSGGGGGGDDDDLPRARRALLRRARDAYERFLHQLDGYGLLAPPYARLLAAYTEAPESFSMAGSAGGGGSGSSDPTADAAARRNAKIASFRAEKALQDKLAALRQQQQARRALQRQRREGRVRGAGGQSNEKEDEDNDDHHEANDNNDDDDDDDEDDDDEEQTRALALAELEYSAHQALQGLESLNREDALLAQVRAADRHGGGTEGRMGGLGDNRQRPRDDDQRAPASTGRGGPSLRQLQNMLGSTATVMGGSTTPGGALLTTDGKPRQPFTILGSRAERARAVFQTGHSLPTMSIDEYLEEERRRGGIVDGGGPASGRAPEPDEDDMERADAETMKARAWDEFTEANPKGAGNTLNRG